MNPPRKRDSFALVFSLLLTLSGVVALGFTYLLFPSLVPGYGGGEPFYLDERNDFSTRFPWYANSRLHLTIRANDTVDIYTDDSYVYSGAYYELAIEPKAQVAIMLKSSSSVVGRFTARQEIPWEMQVGAFGLFFLGLVPTILLAFRVWFKRQQPCGCLQKNMNIKQDEANTKYFKQVFFHM